MALPMDLLISKLIRPHRLAQCGLNKVVSLLLKRHSPGGVTAMFQVCCAKGFQFASQPSNLHFH